MKQRWPVLFSLLALAVTAPTQAQFVYTTNEGAITITGYWVPLATNTLTNGSFFFSDSAWTNFPCRYYRVSSP